MSGIRHLPLPAVIDANVLFSFILRDTILRAAEAGLCQPYWSEEILAETSRNLIRQGRATAAGVARMWALVNEVFPEANVTSYGKHLPGLTNHVKDRHVVAAALEAGVTVIVTDDMGDFVPLPEGLRAMSADTFLLELFNRAPDQMFDLLHLQVADFRQPPMTFEELLNDLEHRHAPRFAAAVRKRLAEGDIGQWLPPLD